MGKRQFGVTVKAKLNCDVNSSWSPLISKLYRTIDIQRICQNYISWFLTYFSIIFNSLLGEMILLLYFCEYPLMALLYIERFCEYCRSSRMVFNKSKREIILYDKWLKYYYINVILFKKNCLECDKNMIVLRIGIFKRIRLYH